jgi:hypothetical protein
MYAIVLQLTGAADSYGPLSEAIKALGDWSARVPTLWLVQTPRSARQIRDTLKPHLLAADRAFVAHFDRNWSAFNMGEGFGEWMARRSFDPPAGNAVTPTIATPLSLSQPAGTAPRRARSGVGPPPKK